MVKLYNKAKNFLTKAFEKKLKFDEAKNVATERLGSDYGGWVIPANVLNGESICYCVGAGLDISFDMALAQKYKCKVYILDPTPGALSHYEKLVDGTKNNVPVYTNNGGEKYNIDLQDLDYIHYFDVGLWNEDTTLKFYVPQNKEHISHSALNLQGTTDFFEAEVNRLSTFMKKHNHQHIDLLKLDIEGAEYKVINDLLSQKISVDVVCVEFDENHRNNIDSNYIDRIQDILDQFEAADYKLIHSEEGNNFTFAKNDIVHHLIK